MDGVTTLELDYSYDRRERVLEHSIAQQRLYRKIAAAEPGATALLRRFARHMPLLRAIAPAASLELEPTEPCWNNGWLPGLDGVTLYGLLAERNPRWYVEVGSGNSTCFARRAIRDHDLRTRIISIDPEPRASIDSICDTVVRQRLEDVDPQRFGELTSEDLLFVDCSHRSFQGSDVTVFFTEMLPVLPDGLFYGVHDIFLPLDYPGPWRDRFYNEQYLLAAYLFGGADGDRIVLPNVFLTCFTPALRVLDELWLDPRLEGIEASGVAFWMERGGARNEVRDAARGSR